MTDRLTSELLALLGDDAFVALVQTFGGRRLYVPHRISSDHDLWQALGEAPAHRLVRRYFPAVIRVPLAREIRARYYLSRGKSYGEIASLLGVTETAVDKIFARMNNAPVKGSARQLRLFNDD